MRKTFTRCEITYNGKTMTLPEWAHELGLPYSTVRMRYTRGETDPVQLFRPLEYRSNLALGKGKHPARLTYEVLYETFPQDVIDNLQKIADAKGITPIEVAIKIIKHYSQVLATQ